jgi:hypothetical protein
MSHTNVIRLLEGFNFQRPVFSSLSVGTKAEFQIKIKEKSPKMPGATTLSAVRKSTDRQLKNEKFFLDCHGFERAKNGHSGGFPINYASQIHNSRTVTKIDHFLTELLFVGLSRNRESDPEVGLDDAILSH